jgi:hypothetical protein
MSRLKNVLVSNITILKDFINKYQHDLLLSTRELHYLMLILFYFETEDKNIYFSSLIDCYKNMKHEETLYKILEYIVENNQINRTRNPVKI